MFCSLNFSKYELCTSSGAGDLVCQRFWGYFSKKHRAKWTFWTSKSSLTLSYRIKTIICTSLCIFHVLLLQFYEVWALYKLWRWRFGLSKILRLSQCDIAWMFQLHYWSLKCVFKRHFGRLCQIYKIWEQYLIYS